MSIFSRLFRKGRGDDKQDTQENEFDEYVENDVYDDDSYEYPQGNDDDDATFGDDDEDNQDWGDTSLESPSDDADLDINYRGALLSPTQKSKESQYQEILDNITEETIAIIDNALKIEGQLYDVFEHIESKGISLLTLVALEMTSEEDISAYQLKKQRQFENTGLVEDTEYANEVAQSQLEKPRTTQFEIDSEDLDRVEADSVENARNVAPIPTAQPFHVAVEEAPSVVPTEIEPPPTFSGAIFGGMAQEPVQSEFQTEHSPPVTATPPLPRVDTPLPPVDSGITGMPKGSPFTSRKLDALLGKDEPLPLPPKITPDFASMELAEDSPTVAEPKAEPLPQIPVMAVEEKQPEMVAHVPKPIAPPVPETPMVAEAPTVADKPTVTEPPKVASFFTEMEQVKEDSQPKQEEKTVTKDAVKEKAGTFAGVDMEFEGYEEKPDEDTSGSPTDVLDGLRALLTGKPTKTSRRSPVIAPTLSDKKVEEKAQQVQKYKRQSTVKDKRIFILWEGLTLPQIEGYQFIPVSTPRDLSKFGLDTNDLLVVTSKIPKGFADSIDAYLANIREEEQPYRIVNFSKKAYDTPYIDKTINALTKEAFETYYENNPIVLDNKNQLGGFGGIADFLVKKGGNN